MIDGNITIMLVKMIAMNYLMLGMVEPDIQDICYPSIFIGYSQYIVENNITEQDVTQYLSLSHSIDNCQEKFYYWRNSNEYKYRVYYFNSTFIDPQYDLNYESDDLLLDNTLLK